MIETAQRIIAESSDFMRVCNVKETQAAAYLEKGDYSKAKDILETLPGIMKNDVIAFRLSGRDKLDGAVWSRCDHLQGLYTAWDDFEEEREEIMEFFNRYMKEYDLAEFTK